MMSRVTQTEAVAAASLGSPDIEAVPRRKAVLLWLSERGVIIFTILLIVFAAVFIDGFASFANITDVFYRAAPIGIVALGMTFVVVSGNYLDLSIVAQVATSAVILIGVSNEFGIIPAVGMALLVAVAFGLVNGISVGIFRANAVIVTLSTTYIGLGMLRWLSGGSIVFGPHDGPIAEFGRAKIGSVPLSAIVLVVIAIILWYVMSRTPFGFSIRAFGSSREVTRLSGVAVGSVVIGAFLITSITAMLAGFVLAAFSNTAVSSMATGYDFQALAAIVIGGTSVFGGKGSVLRTLLGVIFVSVLTNILVLSEISYGLQQVAIGILIVIAVSVDVIARRVAKR